MNTAIKSALLVASLIVAGAAFAYTIKDVKPDQKDVCCNSGAFGSSMYWNGTRWSDGLRSDPTPDVVAKQMVAAQGSACQ